MEKIIWVIGNNREDMIDIQRRINLEGSMKAFCMLSFDALLKTINERLLQNADAEVMPSLIIVDYAMEASDARLLKTIKDVKQLAGVPLFFLCDNKNDKTEEECYQKGAMVVIAKPVSKRALVRIERAAWQYENTKQYERFLQQQATRLKMAQEIFALNQQLEKRNEFLHKLFGRYFSDEVLEIILNQPEGNAIGGIRREVAVLSADLRGFSSIAEEMQPDAMTTMLNAYFGRMTDIIMSFHGTIIEFMGDGILAVFGVLGNGRSYRQDAMAASLCMQNSMEWVNEFCDENGYPNLEMGIGLHCGEVFIGNVGSEKMMRYNVLGSIVNECSRIESYSVGGQILISASMRKGLEDKLRVSSMMELAAKGIRKPLKIFALEGLRTEKENYALNNNGKLAMNDVVSGVIFELVPVKNKILGTQYAACELKKISMNEAILYKISDLVDIEQFEDVMIAAHDDRSVLFEQVYAKVIKREGSRLKIRFTHLNHGFKKFVKSVQTDRNDES
jgi:adenylate cyclase